MIPRSPPKRISQRKSGWRERGAMCMYDLVSHTQVLKMPLSLMITGFSLYKRRPPTTAAFLLAVFLGGTVSKISPPALKIKM